MKNRPFSFSSAEEMRARIEMLPSPPRWKETEVKVRGGSTKLPMTLYYRDGLECFEFLFGNPLFRDQMDYKPRREYSGTDKSERLYNEIMTGDKAWALQARVINYRCILSWTKVMVVPPGKTRNWADAGVGYSEL